MDTNDVTAERTGRWLPGAALIAWGRRAAEKVARSPLALLLALTPLAQIVSLLWLIWDRTPDVPWWDEWDTVNFVHAVDVHGLRLADVWAFHNEHRIVIPRLLDLALIEMTHWNRQIEMTVDFLVAVGALTLLLAAVRRSLDSTGALLILTAPLSLLVLSLAAYENFLWAFQITFIATVFGVSLCLWALATRRAGPKGFALAATGAMIASLSSFGGLMAWPAFLPCLWWAGYRRARYLPLWSALAAAVILPYLHGLPHDAPAHLSLRTAARYALAYLGAPAGGTGILRAQLFALVSLVVTPANVLLYARLRRDVRALSGWIGLALFALAVTAVTALGRGSANGVMQALTSRYEAFSGLWWVASAVIAFATVRSLLGHLTGLHEDRGRRIAAGLAGANALLALALLVSLVGTNLAGFENGRAWMDAQRRNERCVRYYDDAPDDCLALYFAPWRVRVSAPYLEADRLNIFHDAPPHIADLARDLRSTGATIDAVGGVDVSRSAQGPVTIPAGGTFAVRGWAVDTPAGATAAGVFVTIDDRAPTWAHYGIERRDVAQALHGDAYAQSGFAAHLAADDLTPGRHTLAIQVVSRDQRAYYAPPQRVEVDVRPSADLLRLASTTRFAIDSLDGDAVPHNAAPILVFPKTGVLIRGWAVDTIAQRPAAGVAVSIDGGPAIGAEYGLPRDDATRALGDRAYGYTGFVATIPAEALTPGRHTLTLKIIAADARGYYQPNQQFVIDAL